MKRASIALIFFSLISIGYALAQSANLGAVGTSRESELTTSDSYSDSRYYEARTFSLKKGQGVLFTMQSSDFKPFIVLAAKAGSSVQGKLDGSGLVCRIAYLAESDTTFYLVHTSAEENKTGKFSYDFKILDAPQMYFSEDFSSCDRLYYLINQWFMDFALIPQKTVMVHDLYLPKDSLKEVIKTNVTFQPSNEGIINNGYEEVLFSIPKDSAGVSRQFYDRICSDIKECLNNREWIFESESKKANPLYVFDSEITTFTLQEGDKKYPCFRIILKKPVLSSLLKTTPDFYYQVILRF